MRIRIRNPASFSTGTYPTLWTGTVPVGSVVPDQWSWNRIRRSRTFCLSGTGSEINNMFFYVYRNSPGSPRSSPLPGSPPPAISTTAAAISTVNMANAMRSLADHLQPLHISVTTTHSGTIQAGHSQQCCGDPDPAFYRDADPDPGSQTNADPSKYGSIHLCHHHSFRYRQARGSGRIRGSVVILGPAFYRDADPDPGSQTYADPSGSGSCELP